MRKSYTELVIPAMLTNPDKQRVAEVLTALVENDPENQLRLALYINGSLDAPTKEELNKPVNAENFFKHLSGDRDYRNRTAVFKAYDFIKDVVSYKYSGEVRHCFKTEEDAQAWLNGGEPRNWGWSKTDNYPFEAWKPCEGTNSCSLLSWMQAIGE